MTEVSLGGRAPAEAVAYFEEKVVGGRFSFDWRDVWQEEHLNAFVVAKGAVADVTADIHAGFLSALKEGKTQQQFAAELKPLLEAKGWWGKKAAVDPLTGQVVNVQLGSPRRLAVIFDTNMRMAHSAGRWERFSRSAATRFLVYRHTPQPNPREQHQAWDQIILPFEHPFWRTHYTPNGWGCKCFTTTVRKSAAEETSEADLEGRGVNQTRTWENKRTGAVETIPKGIDPGFAYNVGQARLDAFKPGPMPAPPQRPVVVGDRRPQALPDLSPRPMPPDAKLRPELASQTSDEVFDAFSKVLGKGEGEVFIDRAQVPLVLGRRIFQAHDAAGVSLGDKAGLAGRAEFAEILGATLRDPDEIWHSLQTTEAGGSILVRNYVAAFDTGDAGRQLFTVTFHEGPGQPRIWWGASAFPPGARGRVGDQVKQAGRGARVGSLVYSRK